MRFVVIDFETFYSDEFTLSKMTTESYIRDPRFEAHGASIKWGKDFAAQWYNERELRFILKEEDWSDTCIIHHHAQFDALILSHHYNVHPKMLACTLAMSRLLIGNHVSASLESVRKHFGISPKTTPYNLFKGKHWNELDSHTRQLIADGANDEVESIWRIFGEFMKTFPLEELEVQDSVIKMFTEPVLRADSDLLAKIWESENTKKEQRMKALNISSTELQSSEKFAELLRAEGEDPEMKDGKNGPIYAFAKTDNYMRDVLLEHDNERIRALAEARLGAKSTLMQTRAATLGWMATRGPLCVYLNYAGAGTLRPSGGDGANWLNFKRGSLLRKAILAPEGYLLAPVDSSQIECRVLHYLAGGPDDPVLRQFRNHEDPYADLASKFYGEIIYKPKANDRRREEMEAKRGAGKQGCLMAGYGCAAPKFKATAKNGLYGPPIDMPIEEAERLVDIYRAETPSVCHFQHGYWAQCNKMLARIEDGSTVEFGPLTIRNKRVYLPNGCPIIYDTLTWHKPEPDEPHLKEFERKGYWRVKTRNGYKKMWGAKLTQNFCEAVSRVIVTQAQVRLARMGYRTLNHPYDELLLLIPKDGHEDKHVETCMAEMKREVSWLPGLPLDCDCTPGERYEK